MKLQDILNPDDATVEKMEAFYQESQAAVPRDGADEMSFREGFRAGWKAMLRLVRAAK